MNLWNTIKASAVSLVTVGIFASGISPAMAQVIEQDNQYIYQVFPTNLYQKYMSDENDSFVAMDLQRSMLIALRAATTEFAKFSEKQNALIPDGVVPEEITQKDLEKLLAMEASLDRAFELANEFARKKIADHKVEYQATDMLPDAIFVLAGGATSLLPYKMVNVLGSAMLGFIVMPVVVKKIDKQTGATISLSNDVRTTAVVWAGPDVGVDLDRKDTSARFGFGFIWDFDEQFLAPGQFTGLATGLSRSWSFLPGPLKRFGLNIKGGALNNFSQSGLNDLYYMTYMVEKAKATALPLRGNITWVQSLEKVLEDAESIELKHYNLAYKKLLKDYEKALKEEMKTVEEEEKKDKKASAPKAQPAIN